MAARPMEKVKSWMRHLPAVIGLALLVAALYVVQKEFRHLKLKDIGDALAAIPPMALVISFIWTVLSYGILTFYDRLGTIYAGHKVSYGKVAFASFCAYSLSHNLGFAAVSGAAVRFRLYAHWGLTPLQIGKTVAFCSLTFALGGLVLGGLILFAEPRSVPFFGQNLPLWALYGVGAGLWAVVIAYITLSRVVGPFRVLGHEIALPGWRMAVLQVVLATVDVAVTANIFYALLPETSNLTWLIFLGVYVTSYTAGLAANLPGGIGVFDTAMLFGLAPYVDAPHIVGAIVVFRLYYYIIPLFLAGFMFAGNELVVRGGGLMQYFGRNSALQALGRWSEPDFAVASTTGAVALSGFLMLVLGVLAPHTEFSWLDRDYADMANQAGQFAPSLIGAGLVTMAIGLSQRVNLAWGLTIVLLIVGAAFAATQNGHMWVSIVLILTTLLVAPFRASFYRHARLLSGPLQPSTALPLAMLTICLLALTITRTNSFYLTNDAWWAVVLSPQVPHSIRLAVAIAVLLAAIALWLLLRPGHVRYLAWDPLGKRKLATLGLGALGGGALGGGALGGATLGGVSPERADGLLMGENDRAGVAFRRVGSVLLALGDPVGAEMDRISTIWRLRDLAHQEGLEPAVWRAGPELLKVYGDIGLTAFPLGSDGLPLPESATETPLAREYLVCLAERDMRTLLPLLPSLADHPAPAE